eukprot:g1654.t1
MRIDQFEMMIVDKASGVPLPEFEHEGKTYVISEPGKEFEVVTTTFYGRQAKIELFVDSEKVDMTKNVTSSNPQVWPGFPTNNALTQFNAFMFAPAEIAEPGQAVPGGEGDPHNGTIRAIIHATRKVGKKKGGDSSWQPRAGAGTREKLVKKAGKKFFQNPSMTTAAGSACHQEAKLSKNKYIKEYELARITIHAEMLEILRLRGIPVPDGLVRAFFDQQAAAAGGAGAGAGASANASASTGTSASISAVKSESQRPRKRQRRAEAAADVVDLGGGGDGGGAGGGSGGIIDLT